MSPPGVEVLFDATDQIYDDFGDFETVPPEVPPLAPSSPQTRTQVVDLLGVSPLASPYLERPKSPSSKERNPFADLSAATKPQQSARKAAKEASTPVTAWPSFTSPKPAAFQDSPALPAPPSDEWADFPDDEDSPSATEQWKSSVPKRTAMPLTLPPRASRPPATSSPSTARPTNVPPPSILLTLFPPLLTSFNPANASSLVAHLSTARTLARILAGRRQRWKRDASLAQSTKIGPASSGRSSGMKLAGLDRAESAREEREAAEVLRAWRTSVGRLRAAVGTARHHSASSEPWRYHVPALASPAPQTRLATASQGGISAPQACALCGLRRNERVLGVDDDDTSTSPADEGDGAARTQVRDSFGEWWAEHWGHVECRDFWTTHEGTLRGR
ncbi:MAG: hypothetical protein M1832_003173 [Thelocarpon impressellum]|nr:MAG: hypothetical protein M1832_003173 [Thelocarpon impressellum]